MNSPNLKGKIDPLAAQAIEDLFRRVRELGSVKPAAAVAAAVVDPQQVTKIVDQYIGSNPPVVNTWLGQLAQPQIPFVSKTAGSPNLADPQSQDGSLNYNSSSGFLERFDQSSLPGSWVRSGYLGGGSDPTITTGSHLLLPLPVTTNLGVNEALTAANDVRAYKFFNTNGRLALTKISFSIQTASAGGLCSVGVYNADGTSLLFSSGAISTTGTGVKNATIAVTLDPGFYWLAWTADNNVATFRGVNNDATSDAVWNDGTVMKGKGANASAAGVLPSTLGAVSSATVSIPVVKLQ